MISLTYTILNKKAETKTPKPVNTGTGLLARGQGRGLVK